MKTLPAIAAFIVLSWVGRPRSAPFGTMPDGVDRNLHLKNSHGMEVRTIPYGAIIVSIRVPDPGGSH
jgi:hypothetical protein